jgi:hypothetical protein
MEELTNEEIRRRLSESTEQLNQLGEVVSQAAEKFVSSLSSFLYSAGVKQVIPSAWIVFAVMQYAELYFGDIPRQDWMSIYDQSRQIRKLLQENPGLIDDLADEPVKSALDVAISEEFGLDFDN